MDRIIHDVDQNSDEWHELRLGKITGSAFGKMIKKDFTMSQSASARMESYRIAAERMTNYVEPQYVSIYMERGHIIEEVARNMYADANGADVDLAGFVELVGEDMRCGCSPDGLVGDDGIIEIKSCMGKFQIDRIIKNEVPDEFLPQINFNLFVTGRQWCDFVSFSGGLPMFVKRVHRHDYVMDSIEGAIMDIESSIKSAIDECKNASKALGLVNTNVIDEEFLL